MPLPDGRRWMILPLCLGTLPAVAAPGIDAADAGTAVLALAAAAAVGAFAGRAALRRRRAADTENLAEAVERLARGELATAPTVSADGGLGPVAQALARMRGTLQAAAGARDYLNQVVTSLGDALLLTRPDGTIHWANPAAERLLGHAAAELKGRTLASLVPEAHQAGFSLADPRGRTRETVFRTAAGDEVPVSYSAAVIATADPALQGYVVSARNITERKLAEQRMRYLAQVDALTKVPNRMQFQHLLQRAIARARRGQHRLALIYLDVDRFKEINDTFGHSAGDTCLETLTTRLTRTLPPSAVVGRLAGDEFGVVLDGLDPARNLRAEVVGITRLVQEAVAEPVACQGHQVLMSVSAGIALYPADGNNVVDLIRNADAALYRAKRQGGGALEVYHSDMNAAAVDRLMLKSRLRKGLDQNELRVVYQPKIDLRDGSIAGAEALVRWELAGRGLLLPGEFIPLAEESPLILEVGEWVLDRVCRDYQQWQAGRARPGRIAVNLSLRQLKQRNFITRVHDIIRRHGIPPEALEFEITETTLMEDARRTVRILDELHAMGLALAIDDFGTGYSSLSALQQFPIGTLKIDQSFVRHATTSHDQATIVAMVVEMGHSLGKDVVAEGVEAEDQLRFLRALNCDYAQGLLFGPPMPADAYADLLADHRHGAGRYRPLFARG
ncbi:MAG: EAL domain-containing protein [Chromatiales bacterium]|jgi:diguanylate cyclase (GGDEF)-like protein/PAS domain S-box-containing protein|nr:EAL domain-containing protein [Chromatiales bacterium]